MSNGWSALVVMDRLNLVPGFHCRSPFRLTVGDLRTRLYEPLTNFWASKEEQ